jgi:glycosyltransferase involved in cell wall biosynthesis
MESSLDDTSSIDISRNKKRFFLEGLMIRILMCGPIAKSGGVSNHTQCLANELKKFNIYVITHNLVGTENELDHSNFRKIYQRTLGLINEAFRRRNDYDIIHVQVSGGFFSFITAVTGTIVSRTLCKPFVVTFHYRPSRELIEKYKIIFSFVLANVDAFIVVSEKQKKFLQDCFHEYSNKIMNTTNGYDDIFRPIDKDNCRRSLGLSNDKKILICIGNLLPEKGHRYIINSIKSITQYRNDILCIIVGSGKLKNDLEQEVLDSGLAKNFKFVGEKDHKQIPVWINASDIFVLPSLAEGNPTVMFEALGCGKPFVGTKVGGVPEIIISEDYGLLVKPADPEDLAEKILIALNREWDREAILQYAQKFTWENIAKEIIVVYEQIIK